MNLILLKEFVTSTGFALLQVRRFDPNSDSQVVWCVKKVSLIIRLPKDVLQ